MLHLTRSDVNHHIYILDGWLHNGKIEKPSSAQMAAIKAAVDVMQELSDRWEYEKPIAILTYHINQPLAVLFRDPVTLKTMKAAIMALNRKRAELEDKHD